MKLHKHNLIFFKAIARVHNFFKRLFQNRSRYKHKSSIHYGPSRRQVFDLYYTNKERMNILLVDIHGGFYVGASRNDNFNFAQFFLKKGIDVALVEYRLNNKRIETVDELDDTNRCISFIYNNLSKLDLEYDEIYLTGDSAGGHFALLNAINVSHKTILGRNDYKISGVLLNCPAYNYQNYGELNNMTDGLKRWVLGKNYKNKNYLETLSPKTYIEGLNTKIFISTSKYDFLRNESYDLIKDLDKYNKPYTFLDIDTKNILAGHVHNVVSVTLRESVKVNKAMYEFMTKQVKN